MDETIEYLAESTTYGIYNGQTVTVEHAHTINMSPHSDHVNIIKMLAIKEFRVKFPKHAVTKVVVHYYVMHSIYTSLTKLP